MAFPYLMLLVSGGHCQFLLVEAAWTGSAVWAARSTMPRARRFDKTAKLLGLPQPGGPVGRGRGIAGRCSPVPVSPPASGPRGL
jgi:N6-L-threonylcarbamoyladenine synthase